MRISDNLRQETMPDMVYAICKLALENPTKADMQKLITLDDNKSKEQFNNVYNFSVACEFIREDAEGRVSAAFTKSQLVDFRHYSYAVFSQVFKDNNRFTILAKWFLSQKVPGKPIKGQNVLNLSSETDFRAFLPATIRNDLKVEENFFNGFRFWMTALGLTAFYSPGSSMSGVPLLFATQKAIRNWIEFEKPFESGSFIPAEFFFRKMVSDCPVFSDSLDFDHHSISSSVSSGLRILESAGLISLVRIADAGDLWHLSNSIYYSKSNEISDIVIKEVKNA